MQESEYNQLNVKEKQQLQCDRRQWIFLLRQLFVCSGSWMLYFILGLCFGAPSVFIPQIRREANSTEAISLEMESWLTSVHGYSALPFIFIIPIFSQYFGRKIPFIIVCINTIVCFIIFYWSNNTMHLLVSEILQGMLLASNMNLLIVIITEYTSPHYRGIFMSIESSVFFWGVWVANVTGTFSQWKNIGLIAFACCGFCLSAFWWPESPSWLAMKGRFEECSKAHYWLKGYGEKSKNELNSLINSQKDYFERCQANKVICLKDKLKSLLKTSTTRGFYQPLLLSMTVASLFHFSGKMVCTMYSVQLVQQITKDEFTAFMGMIILEGVTIMGMHIGCILTKILSRRTLLLLFSALGISFLFIISLYLYLVNLGVFLENKYVSISLLMAFSVTISIGPMIIPAALFGELISFRYKSTSLLILCLYTELLMATVLKLSPYIFQILTLHGAFLFYAICSSILTIILFRYLPETKDKTLLEIDEFFISRPQSRDSMGKLLNRK